MAYVSNAWKQTKRGGPKNDSATTAGAGGKVPRVGVNKSDLEAQGAQHGWTIGPVTAEQVKAMSSAALRWHEQFNAENLEKAFTTQKVDTYNKNVRVNQASRRMWDGQATEEESQQAFAAGDRFASNYSQFVRSEANAKAITAYMEEHNLDATKVESYIEAFDVLAPQGKLVLSPKAAGIGLEESLTGAALERYPRLHLLCQPNKVLKPQDKLSADEWFREHPELHDSRTPPIVAARNAKAEATAQHFQQAAEHTNTANVVTVVDYPDDQTGYPAAPTKYSFRRLLDSLSAADFNKRLNEDKAFSDAVDKLNNGNR